MQRNAEFHGKDIHRPHGQDSKRDAGSRFGGPSGNSIHHFIDRAIPSCGDYRGESLPDCGPRKGLTISGHRTETDFSPPAQGMQAIHKPCSLVAVCSRVQDNKSFFHDSKKWD